MPWPPQSIAEGLSNCNKSRGNSCQMSIALKCHIVYHLIHLIHHKSEIPASKVPHSEGSAFEKKEKKTNRNRKYFKQTRYGPAVAPLT